MNTSPQLPTSPPANAIAVIGMAARFPGADSVSAFWRNLRHGHEAIVDLSEADLAAAGVPDHALANPAYVRRAALFDGIAEFDADFFGFTPQGARMMDPQHRLFLQCAWHALEDTGYEPADLGGSVGVYGTSSASGYLLHNLMSHQDPNRIIGQGATFEMINLSLQNDKDYLATRIAHQFNLRGPALAVQTACSSSLVAVHLACQSILSGECDVALAGASSIRVPHHVGYWHEPGSMVSATGHCRPFDVRADGTVFGSGVAVLVLKAFHAAVADGDRIHAVIRGSAINNDGSTKMNYAAPNAAGQAEVIAEAHAVAEVDASTISYVETHGTGTPLGDPIEIEGLRQAFELSTTSRSGPCVIGSVKSNIGHLEVASGIAGLVKTILCLQHRAIPATLHYTSPNPQLRLERSPFVVRSAYSAWDGDGVRRAGVSSFGVGGTNAHLVVEEAPALVSADVPAGPQVLLLSARTAAALQDSRRALAAHLSDGDDDTNLSDVAHTLANRRGENVRAAAVVDGRQHAAEVLGAPDHDNVFVGESGVGTGPGSVAFTFPGQGAQHAGMARGLYESEPVFAQHFNLCAAGFADEMDVDLRAEIFEGNGRGLEHTHRTQPALFAVEYALAQLLEAYGVRPAAVAGHSIGEYAAATIAGVFELPTAIKAVATRARLMHAAPTGVMVAVALPHDLLAEHLTPDVDVAAVNESGSCVVAGSDESIRSFQERLSAHGVVARRVRTSHAFHSRLMDAVVPEFAAFLSGLALREPRIPMLSNVTGTWMTAEEATDPQHWARQIRATVRFADELGVLLADPSRVLVEVGPGGTLTASAMRHDRWAGEHRAVRLMRHPVQNRSDRDTFLLGLGQLWAAGVPVDWTPLSGGRRPQRVTVPGYPFDRQRHWVEHRASAAVADGGVPVNGARVSPVEHTAAGGAAGTSMEATLQRIWGQCLGLDSIDRSANFFELGGDSLVAISVAMTAANEGLDLTPQDLYENQTVAALAAQLTARYASGLAGRPPADAPHPPVPPNLAHLLGNGVGRVERWRIPFLLRLRPDVQIGDVRAVLTAVTNHHDALRLRIASRAGTWEQHVEAETDAADVATRTLPADVAAGSPEEREAVLTVLDEQMRGHDDCTPLSATYIRGSSDGPCHLAISLHGVAGDNTSRDILLADLFTAFGQRLAGQDIALPPVTTSWQEWSQRCAALATHPAVVESREFWLQSAEHATLRITPAEPSGSEPARPDADHLHRHPTELSPSETAEIDEARRRLRLPIEEILLAALGRTVAATVGAGAIAVDVGGSGRSVLKPEVSLHRTVGWFTTIYPIALPCAAERDASARQLIDDVHETLKAVPHHGIGYGLLRYLYGPTARAFDAVRPADIHFDYAGTIPDLPPDAPEGAAVQFDPDTAMPVRAAIPGLGHAVELRIYRSAAQLHMDWWHDDARIAAGRAADLAQTYLSALMELIREAMADDELGSGAGELTLVDLSSDDIGMGEANAQKR
ncbi:type I polyketide synthase [Mycolicibacterium baixiangningiae]|uniref:type I polyketide synthase n=1 Tax=Mycolicibacterium baixiangningiae TaxID=2761578 RepID=UPI0018D1ADA5|nr:type I polyketide synthase [Mycolicibacterium baixiangningiae]